MGWLSRTFLTQHELNPLVLSSSGASLPPLTLLLRVSPYQE